MAGTFNQSLQCTQDVFIGFQAPLPPVTVLQQYGMQNAKSAATPLPARYCHRYDILVRLWNRLNFFELFKTLFSLGIDHDPPMFSMFT